MPSVRFYTNIQDFVVGESVLGKPIIPANADPLLIKFFLLSGKIVAVP